MDATPIRQFTFTEQRGAVVLASEACARAFAFGSPRAFATWVRAHYEEFGAVYERDLVPGQAPRRLNFDSLKLVLLVQLLRLEGAVVAIIAAVQPGEEEVAERSIATVRETMVNGGGR